MPLPGTDLRDDYWCGEGWFKLLKFWHLLNDMNNSYLGSSSRDGQHYVMQQYKKWIPQPGTSQEPNGWGV